MKRYWARLAVGTVLALTALSNSVSLVAAEPAPTPAPGTLLIVAGTGEQGFSGDGGAATQARMNAPFGVAVDTAGDLFIAEKVNARVRRVGLDGIIHTVAGGGNTFSIPVEGIPATEARLDNAQSLAFDGAGNLFIAAVQSSRVWKVSPQGQITTIHKEGSPFGVAVDAAGNLFFTELANARVRKVTPEGIISTVAGGGTKPPRTAVPPPRPGSISRPSWRWMQRATCSFRNGTATGCGR